MPVLDSLMRKLMEMRKKLERDLAVEVEVEGLEWIKVEPRGGASFTASDSSRHEEPLRYALIYAAQGIAIRKNERGKDVLEDAEADYLILSGYRGQREVWEGLVSNSFKTLEVRLAYRLPADYALFDGSYPGFAVPRLPAPGEADEQLRPYYERACKYWGERVNMWREMMENNVQLVFVSKSVKRAKLTKSGSLVKVRTRKIGEEEPSELLSARPPDFMIVESVDRDKSVGFLWGKDLIFKLWGEEEEKTLCEEQGSPRPPREYTLTYARLKPRGPLYQITVPAKLDEKKMEEIIAHLSYISTSGYPDLLAEAHHLSVLRSREFRDLVKMLPRPESGREVLEPLRKSSQQRSS
ncbi:MAG: DNA double-strand break repair nuclease NurA [Acidilobaceae archaeon]|nr:DNA double-strand break repair nuclease NurA [Acidilobaceae archaeon]